jgi:hypothetical protein
MRHSETKTGKKNGELRNVGLQMEIIKKCEWCSQNYVAHSKLSRFCCRECSDKAYKKKRIQEKEKGITKMTAVDFERQCDYCGQTYVAHRLTSHYCSKQCCRLAYKVKTRGDKLSKKVVAERKKHVATKIRDLGVNDNVKVYQKIIQKYTISTECCKGTKSLLYITYC